MPPSLPFVALRSPSHRGRWALGATRGNLLLTHSLCKPLCYYRLAGCGCFLPGRKSSSGKKVSTSGHQERRRRRPLPLPPPLDLPPTNSAAAFAFALLFSAWASPSFLLSSSASFPARPSPLPCFLAAHLRKALPPFTTVRRTNHFFFAFALVVSNPSSFRLSSFLRSSPASEKSSSNSIDRLPRRNAMGRAMRWLKKVLTGGKKEPVTDRPCKDPPQNAARAHGDGAATIAVPPIERRRWSFAKARSSVADASSRRPSVTAVVAGELSQVRPCCCGQDRDTDAAVLIQKAFRGYLARKALRALKSLVKLQALVRGYLVRRQTATTLHRLQALMRLQASSHALKNPSYRRSIEQERKASLPVAHRRRLSEGGDAGFDRSPRIVEMDTCQLRSRSSRIPGRYAAADHATPPPASPLPYYYFCKPPSRLQLRELEPRPLPKTTHNTPRLGVGALPAVVQSTGGSPAKARPSCGGGGGRESSSPRYMADTASSVARTRCQSAPRQRHAHAAPGEQQPRQPHAVSKKTAPQHLQPQDSFSFKGSEATGRVEDYSEMSDEVTRDYYLDQLW